MLATLKNVKLEGATQTLVAAMIAFLFAGAAFATTSSTVERSFDAAMETMYTSFAELLTGNVGKILMTIMIIAGIYFGAVQPNFVIFAAVAASVIVLANGQDIIEGTLGASYDLLAPATELLQVIPQL
jgi:type IV secretory pathway VirB2 component (pilin)